MICCEAHSEDGYYSHVIFCPGCGHHHYILVPRWSFNGSLEAPTFSPSVRHFYTKPDTREEVTVCHYFVKEGKIEFCGDCQHSLSGQSVPLPHVQAEHLLSLGLTLKPDC